MDPEIPPEAVNKIRHALELAHEVLRRNALLDFSINNEECGDVLRDAIKEIGK